MCSDHLRCFGLGCLSCLYVKHNIESQGVIVEVPDFLLQRPPAAPIMEVEPHRASSQSRDSCSISSEFAIHAFDRILSPFECHASDSTPTSVYHSIMFITVSAFMPTVAIQALTSLPKTYVRNGQEHKTRKRFPAWITVGRFPVLYCDRKVIIVRQFCVESIYAPDGSSFSAGYSLGHPKAKHVPYKLKMWRIHPDSVAKLRGCTTVTRLRKKS